MGEKAALEMKKALENRREVDFQVCTLGKPVVIKKNMVSIRMKRKKEHQIKGFYPFCYRAIFWYWTNNLMSL